MNWSRLVLSAVGPLLLALPVAVLFWRRRQALIGSVVGAGVILLCAVMFMALEYGEAAHYRRTCAERNVPCLPGGPSDFVRIFSYAMVGMVDVMFVFVVGGSIESRQQRQHRAPEWR